MYIKAFWLLCIYLATAATVGSAAGNNDARQWKGHESAQIQLAFLGDLLRDLGDGVDRLLEGNNKEGEADTNGTSGSNSTRSASEPKKTYEFFGLSLETHREIQTALNTLGYPVGTPDGIPGPKTQAAIRDYQAQHKLPVTGEPSLALLSHLRDSSNANSTGSSTSGETAEIVPEDILQSTLADNANYAEFRERFTVQKVNDIVDWVEKRPSLDVQLIKIHVLARIYGLELPKKFSVGPRVLLETSPLKRTDEDSIQGLLQLTMQEIADANGVTVDDLRILNDARNIHQIREDEDAVRNGNVARAKVAADPLWELLPPHKSAFHTIGYEPGTIEKWVAKDGKELVFQKRNGEWVFIKDGINSGTYNYAQADSAHTLLDIFPWLLWGAGGNEKLRWEQRLAIMREQLAPYLKGVFVETTFDLASTSKELADAAIDRLVESAQTVKSGVKRLDGVIGASDSLTNIRQFLQENFSDTYDAIWNADVPEIATKEAQLRVAYVVAKLVHTPIVGEKLLERISLDSHEFVKFATQQPSAAWAAAGLDFSKGVVKGVAEELIVSTAASLVTDALFKLDPWSKVPAKMENPLRAFVQASIVETYAIVRAATSPSEAPEIVIGKVFDRYYEVIKIIEASRLLAAEQDQGLLASAFAAETAARLVTRYPTQKSKEVAESSMNSMLSTLKDIVGKDDEEKVKQIMSLGYQALVVHFEGDAMSKAKHIKEINAIAGSPSNIKPWSAVTNFIDWATLVANKGKDAHYRAGEIVLSSTALADDVLLADSRQTANRENVENQTGAAESEQTSSAKVTPEKHRSESDSSENCKTEFIKLAANSAHCGYQLDTAGNLRFNREGIPGLSPIVVTHAYRNGKWEPSAVATNLVLFPSSPSGRYRVIQACENDLCWDVRLFDTVTKRNEKVSLGKYGPRRWIKWSPSGRFAVLYDDNDGGYWLHVVDMERLTSFTYPEGYDHLSSIDLESFKWIDDDVFSIIMNDSINAAFKIQKTGVALAEVNATEGQLANLDSPKKARAEKLEKLLDAESFDGISSKELKMVLSEVREKVERDITRKFELQQSVFGVNVPQQIANGRRQFSQAHQVAISKLRQKYSRLARIGLIKHKENIVERAMMSMPVGNVSFQAEITNAAKPYVVEEKHGRVELLVGVYGIGEVIAVEKLREGLFEIEYSVKPFFSDLAKEFDVTREKEREEKEVILIEALEKKEETSGRSWALFDGPFEQSTRWCQTLSSLRCTTLITRKDSERVRVIDFKAPKDAPPKYRRMESSEIPKTIGEHLKKFHKRRYEKMDFERVRRLNGWDGDVKENTPIPFPDSKRLYFAFDGYTPDEFALQPEKYSFAESDCRDQIVKGIDNGAVCAVQKSGYRMGIKEFLRNHWYLRRHPIMRDDIIDYKTKWKKPSVEKFKAMNGLDSKSVVSNRYYKMAQRGTESAE